MKRSLFAVATLGTVLVTGIPGSLAAHPALLRATPGEGALLGAAPPEIRLTFSEPVSLRLAEVELLGPSGAVPLGELAPHPDSSEVVIIAVRGPMESGTYVVRWAVVGDDGHPVGGEYGFSLALESRAPPATGVEEEVGDEGRGGGQADSFPPGGTEATRPPSGTRGPAPGPEGPVHRLGVGSPLYTLVRWLNFAGILGALGAAAFGLLILPLARLRSGRQAHEKLRARITRVGEIAGVVVMIAAVARFVAQRAAVFGMAAALDLGRGTEALLATAWGLGWVLQVAAGIGAFLGFRLVSRGRGPGWMLIAAGAILLAPTPALSGHAASAGGLSILADTLHVVGAGGWIGGLLILLLAALEAGKEDQPGLISLAELVEAFSSVALVFAAILVATGAIGAWTHMGRFSDLWESGYGRVFLLKLGLFSLLLAVGAYNFLRMRPALVRGERSRGLHLSAGVELAVATGILLVTSVLVATPQPGEDSADPSSGSVAAVLPGPPDLGMHVGQIPGQQNALRAVQAFHEALGRRDSAGAAHLLAEDAVILEGGALEDRNDYLAHHLLADMAFASAVERTTDSMQVTLVGDVAWVVSRSRTSGVVRDRPIDATGVELMVLTRQEGGWRIRAVHWSSGG